MLVRWYAGSTSSIIPRYELIVKYRVIWAFAAEEFREPLRIVVREQVYSTNCGHPH